MRNVFRGARYANVTSTMALVVALGGTGAYAANTIRSSDIVNGQVKRADIANNAVSSAKVANGSLRVGDFRASDRSLLRGPAGATGAAGPAGPTGATGATGATGPAGATNAVIRTGTLQAVNNGAVGIATVSCLAGERAVGGGSSISGSAGWQTIESFPLGGTGNAPTGWRVDALNGTGVQNNLVAIAVCVSP